MPTYDYQCRSCGSVTEVIHSMLENGPTACERCGGQLRRVLYPTGIIFKGSGFYRTDSRAAKDGGTSGETTPSAAPGKESKADTSSGSASGHAKDASGDAKEAKAS